MADGDGVTDVIDLSGNGKGVALNVYPDDLPIYINIKRFGAVGDGVTDDSAAFANVQTYLAAYGQSGYGYNVGVARVFVPIGRYYMGGTPLDVVYPVRWDGEGTGGAGGGSTVLIWNNTSSGVRVQAGDTVGDTAVQTAPTPYHRGAESIFDGFMFEGGFTNGDEAERHAVNGRGTAHFRNCMFMNWAGDVFAANASAGGPEGGNANLFSFIKCWAQNCRNGFRTLGADANAGSFIDCSAVLCRAWGFLEQSFLGNANVNPHTSSCGRNPWSTGLANRPCCYVSHGGNHYFVIDGQEAWASINAPTGTTADNTGWGYHRAGGVSPTTGVPAWFNGINVRSGGGYLVRGLSNSSVFIGLYQENDQVSQIDQNAIIIGGHNSDVVRTSSGIMSRKVSSISAAYDGIRLNNNTVINGDIIAQRNGAILQFGPQSGAIVDTQLFWDSTNNISHTFRTWVGGVPVTMGKIDCLSAFGMLLYGTPEIRFYSTTTLIGTIVSTGLSLEADKVIKINGNQVVGARQAAIANIGAAPTAADYNAILAVLRAHGLIAP